MNIFELIDGRLYQWDTNRKIKVLPQEGKKINEVHFAHEFETDALPVEVDSEGLAKIPDNLLQSDEALCVWAVAHTDDGRQTLYNAVFTIRGRAKPEDYIYTEPEIKSYEKLEKRIEALEENGGGGGAVESVNGQTGAVKLTASDIGAIPSENTGTIKSKGVLIAGDGQTHYACMEGGDGRAMFSMRDAAGNIINRVSLRESETTLGQPLAVSSGGHGGKNAEEGRENLSLYSKSEVDSKVAKIEGDIERLTEEIDNIRENGGGSDERLDKIASFFDLSEPAQSNNLLNLDTLVRGYFITSAGKVYDNTQYVYTDYIAVKEGGPVSIQYTLNGSRMFYGIGFIAAYDESKNLLSDKGASSVSPYFTVPEGVAFLRLSFSMLAAGNVNNTDWAIVKSSEIIPYEPFGMIGTEPHLKASAYTHIKNGYSVAVGDKWTADEENHDICGYTMLYKANLPSGLTGSVSVGKGFNGYQGGYITVNPTTMIFYTGETPLASVTKEHGLIIKDYIAVIITLDYSADAKVRIATNGGAYEATMSWAAVRRGKFFVEDANAETTDGRFAYTCHGWGAKTQMYGDSYFGVHNPGRWPYHLVQDGYTDVLINGFSGRNSADALSVLKSVLTYSERPERIVWALGMNDPDKDGAPNASWLACVEEIRTICADNAIELILTTTPLVEIVENTYKNHYVRSSGYRYIDFAAAVGASSDTTWFDDMVYSDGVHPEVPGAIALYYQALADVPELMD